MSHLLYPFLCHVGCFHVLAVVNGAAVSMGVQVSLQNSDSFHLDKHPEGLPSSLPLLLASTSFAVCSSARLPPLNPPPLSPLTASPTFCHFHCPNLSPSKPSSLFPLCLPPGRDSSLQAAASCLPAPRTHAQGLPPTAELSVPKLGSGSDTRLPPQAHSQADGTGDQQQSTVQWGQRGEDCRVPGVAAVPCQHMLPGHPGKTMTPRLSLALQRQLSDSSWLTWHLQNPFR